MVLTRTRRPGPDSAGFTLIELLTVVAIVGILTAAMGPSMVQLAAGSRLDSAQSQFSAVLRLARSEAIKRAAVTVVEPVVAGNWGGRLRVYVDSDGNLTNARTAGDPLVREFPGPGSLQVLAGAPARFALDARGRNVSIAANPVPAESVLTLCARTLRRVLTVEPSGALVTTNQTGAC